MTRQDAEILMKKYNAVQGALCAHLGTDEEYFQLRKLREQIIDAMLGIEPQDD